MLAPELEARIRAVLRRGQPTQSANQIEHGGLVIDRAAHRVIVDGESVDLTPKEFDLLAFLAATPDQVFTAKSCSSTSGDRPRSGRTRPR